MANVDDIRRVCQAGKDKDPSWYIIHRRLSIHITAFLVDTPISLNQVSLLMMAMAATGAWLLTVPVLWVNALAGLCLYLSFLLDKVDGEMARYRGLQSPIGILLDRFHHRLFEPLIFLALGWRAYQATHSTTPLFAALATMLAANIVEEVQHLPSYIAAKHARETREWPASDVTPSPWLRRAAAVFRSLKTFRMFITVVPLALGAIVATQVTGKPVITWLLLTSAVALWVYVVFQAFYYANGGLEEKMTELADSLPPLPPRLRTDRPTPPPSKTPTLSLISSPRPPRPPGQSGSTPGSAPGPAGHSWVLLLACLLLAGRVDAATYYVDNTTALCSNSGAGTITQPYCTISAALAARGVAGNTIMVKAGVYPEQVTILASGTSANPVVIRGFGGPVVVDGADDFSSTAKWTLVSGSVWRASTVNWSPLQVFADGARLTANSGNNVNTLPALSFKYVSGSGLYVNVGNGNPGNHNLKVGRRTNAIVISGKSWITIEGISAARTEDRALNLTNSSDLMYVGGDVTFANKYGVYASNCARLYIANGHMNDNAHHGIMLTGTNDCIVEFNESARNILPGTRNANGIHLTGSSRNVLRNNRWHDNQDTGQHLQSGSADNISSNNLSWNNGDHGFDHLGAPNTFHTNDVCYGNYKDGFSIEGGSTGTRLYNCVGADNGLTTGEYDLWISNDSKSGLASNDNLFFNSTGQNPIKYGSAQYGLVSLFSIASGQDTRTLQLDPRFVAPLSGNFHPAADSPLIDNGNSSVANWPTNDAEGYPRVDDPSTPDTGIGPFPFADRGALEYQTAGLPPIAMLEAWPILGTAPVTVTLDASNSFDPDGSIVSYEFDFGDGVGTAPQAGPVATHKYTAGTYRAIVEVTDDTGYLARDTVVVIANAPPVAAMSATPTTGKAPLTVSFNAASSTDPDGRVTSWLFDFGDGVQQGPQAGATASHVYGTGTWKARLRVTDDRGGTDTLRTPITLTVGAPNVPPTCVLSLNPTSGHAPLTVTANASASSDADGSIMSYQFTFADTLIIGPQAGASATAVLGPGMTHVKVQVTDNDGATSSYTDSLTVLPPVPDRPPVIVAPASVTVAEGATLSVPVTASDPDGNAIVSLTADLHLLPGGNDATFTTAPDQQAGTLTWHPGFTHAGTYPVTFTAANALTAQATTQVVVTETDRAPIVAGPAEVFAPAAPGPPVTFSVTAVDPDGQAIPSLTANLAVLPSDNPGTFTPGPGNASGTFSWIPRAQDAGTYVITVTATNALSGSHSTSLRIGVTDTPPHIVAPAMREATENAPLAFTVTASDPEGEAITSLSADLSGLPAGNNAVFTPAANQASGTLQWTPAFADSGSWVVRFIARNTLADTASTVFHVNNVDRAPVVVAPASTSGPAGSKLSFQVTAVDADGDAVTSLAANLGQLPAGNDATWTLSGGAASGLFTWTPTVAQSGTYSVTFTGTNALAGQATTSIAIGAPNQPPVASLNVTPSQGTAPLVATVDGSGSTDPEGGALTYTFDFGDGTTAGPQPTAVVTHSFGVGTFTVRLSVSDPLGAVRLASATVAVTGPGPGMNYVGNPSFETGASGWNAYTGAALARVAGGYDGSWSMQVTGSPTLTAFGLNDSPNWVASTLAAGARYRFTAWVRSASSTGAVKLQVREYEGGTKIGGSTFSNPVTLSPLWQMVTVDHLAQLAGTSLDFQVFDTPTVPNEVFLVDNVSIHIVPGASSAALTGGSETSGEMPLRFGAWVSPTVLRADGVLAFVTTRQGGVRAQLFDASGRLVRDLLDDANVAPGQHRIALDARSDRGDRLESGMYFYRVQADEQTAVGKVVVAR